MAKLILDLPSELIGIICQHEPYNTIALRQVCRQLYDASFAVFLRHFFSSVPIAAHPISINVLKAIAGDLRFRKAIRTLIIHLPSAFEQMEWPSHHEFMVEGIIRTDLVSVFSDLHGCTRLCVSKWRLGKALGRSQLPMPLSNGRDKIQLALNPSWRGKQALTYATYACWDILQAVALSHNNITAVKFDVMVDFLAFNQILQELPSQVRHSDAVVDLSIELDEWIIFHGLDHLTWEERRQMVTDLGAPVRIVQLYLNVFPQIRTLSIHNTQVAYGHILPDTLPTTIRELSFGDLSRRAVDLENMLSFCRLPNLAVLKLSPIYFDLPQDCSSLLRAVSMIKTVREFWILPLRRAIKSEGWCLDECSPCIKRRSVKRFVTSNVQQDAATWSKRVHIDEEGYGESEDEYDSALSLSDEEYGLEEVTDDDTELQDGDVPDDNNDDDSDH